ncbi:ATP-binding cassette domain-containing protein [Dactylosporangium siamense]|uniref:Daunorubicin resistance protein DrrA family ABC transporter ATP-binding protein n=1 Tax=Dactylosporangium siamense TaxID=685454 RepID=A0A919PL65_9ACTN|nr:ATP-binding cassette domain-containing protein [Dactylosporangium siamense]GIG44168.1 daunorubicin resistance protein DrrA family ABC transporter ATP-binding protein [Dactylosporangium siamense]
MSLAVEATGLTKSYGKLDVLTGVDLAVPAGSVFSLLGPNGAGKTTAVRILATLLRPDGGQARVAGYDVIRQRRQVRGAVSLTGQYAAVDELQTGAENLRMMGRLSGLSSAAATRRAAELLERFDLTAAGNRRAGTYSGGMRRRLDLAAGLVGSPSVIFLDEPTTGLDLTSRQAMWQVIAGLVSAGGTVFLTTQYLEEADQLADRIAVVDHGRVVAEGTPTDLKRRFGDQRLDLELADRTGWEAVAAHLGGRVVQRDPERLTLGVTTDGSAAHVRAVLDEIDPGRAAVRRFSLHSATLDDVFLALTTVKEPAHV